ncbi:hypothetical protein [Actinoplanes lobatus]|uniref:Uncharacterized protein n=1 Tax=Actinoplanes lobatus TaxID=113568 RepID=A0A7W7HHH9_9ACTN|nr:hypothetical protein [Actinoplanes lobatus]MBB4750636.1 hypothetical protein [Actinoplanes lobatus]
MGLGVPGPPEREVPADGVPLVDDAFPAVSAAPMVTVLREAGPGVTVLCAAL